MASVDEPSFTYAPVGCIRTGVVPDGFDELRRSRRRPADVAGAPSRRLAVTASHGRLVQSRITDRYRSPTTRGDGLPLRQ